MALVAHALADIPLELFSLGLLASSMGLIVDSIGQCSTLIVILRFRLFHTPIP
jgi:hypothetical protein